MAFFSMRADVFDQAFADFQGDVADEAVADDHVHVAAENVAAFDVADEVERKLLQAAAASRVSSLPFISSSPMESRATRGCLMPQMVR